MNGSIILENEFHGDLRVKNEVSTFNELRIKSYYTYLLGTSFRANKRINKPKCVKR